jgi:ABC-2 type transport system ATP-binding protein
VPHAIEAEGLFKTFVKQRSVREIVAKPWGKAERIHALRGVDLFVGRGEILGLLGPNGAGKTTLLKILCCLVLPDAGRALVAGIDTREENRVKSEIGLVHSDERSFYWRLSARENLRFFARLYDVPGRRIESRVSELLARVDLTEAADRPFSGYSSGMKQRCAIARALLHDPPILLMDEPTRSLDPAAARALREFVKHDLQRRDGKTVLLATHDLHEAQALSDRVAILVKGRVREVGTVDEVRRWGVDVERFTLQVAAAPGPLGGPFRIEAESAANGLRRLDVALERGTTLDDALRALIAAGASIRSCDRREADLEQAFARILAAEPDGE